MVYLFTEFSKYLMILALLAYLISSIWPLFVHHGDMKRKIFIRQALYIWVIHTCSMFSLYFNMGKNPSYILIYFVQLIAVYSIMVIFPLVYPRCSKMLLNHMCLFLILGFVMLSRLNYEKSVRQFFIVCASLLLFMIIPWLFGKMPYLKNYGFLFATVGIILLGLVFTLGKNVNGSKLSYKIFGLSFQPSEFVKILFVLFIAAFLCENAKILKLTGTAVIAGVFIVLLVLSRDLGSALIYYVVFVVMIFVATGQFRYAIAGLLCGVGAAYLGYSMFSHVRIRVALWLDPWSTIDGSGYQITQSLFAIGTGGWFGMGLGKGDPTTIPLVQEDFMFSAFCEEYGVIFCLILILCYLALFMLLLKIALRCRDNFERLIIIGLSAILVIQIFLTIGGGTQLVPLTGVTLPLMSNGGSSMMSTIILFGLCQSVAIRASVNRATDGESLDYDDEETEDEHILIKKRRRNSYISCGISAVMFAALMINIILYMFNDKDEAISNEYNLRRQELLAAQTIRGSIFAYDGTVLAQTIVDAGGNESRYYPFGDEYAHIVGYCTYGKTGIEDSMNMFLINSNISFAARTENGYNGIKNPGDSVYTTLIPELMDEAYSAMGIYKGAIVVTDVKTGKILAMISNPTFDPNVIATEFENISENDTDGVLLNRATQGLYPPGSTFKVVTALEFIRENPDTYLNYSYNCTGTYNTGDHTIHCFRYNIHGYENLYSSLGNSCNSSFANIGVGLNRTAFADTLLGLYFNTDLPVDITSAQSHVSIREYMTDDEMVQTAIGQGETVMTPIHLNMIMQSIANDGEMMAPYVVDYVQNDEGRIVEQFEPVSLGNVMTSEEATALRDLLLYDVTNGTAHKLNDAGFTAAGKTGSAEYTDNGNDSHAWFSGYAPADDPQICVTIILEGAGTGGDYCVPIAKRLFLAYFALNNE